MPRDDGDYLFVEFDEFMVAMAAHDGQHQRSPNRLLLTLLQFLPLRQPPQLDRVLELDESSLLDLDRQRALIYDFHHRHAKTWMGGGLPVFFEASERY